MYYRNILNSIKDFFNGIIHPLMFIFIEVVTFVCSIYKASWLLNSALCYKGCRGRCIFFWPIFFIVSNVLITGYHTAIIMSKIEINLFTFIFLIFYYSIVIYTYKYILKNIKQELCVTEIISQCILL